MHACARATSLASRRFPFPLLAPGRLRRPARRAVAMAVRVDAAVHTWLPMDGKPDGAAATLLQRMDAASVDHAIIVQPGVISDPFDHSYVAECVRSHEGRLSGVLLARPAEGGVEELLTLAEQGFVGVRFNPGLDPVGDMSKGQWPALYAAAGQKGLPVGFMCFNALLDHVQAIRSLVASSPETTAVIDHCGFCHGDEEWQALLALAELPQVHVKLSAFFRVSGAPFPHADLEPRLAQLRGAFGAGRLLWGSDWPWVDAEGGGYAGACALLEGSGVFSGEELEAVMGGTARELFALPGAPRARPPATD